MASAELIALALAAAQPTASEAVQPASTEQPQAIAEPSPAEPDPLAPELPAGDDSEPAFDEVPVANDPFEPFNRVSYDFSMAVDKIIIRPAAMAYRAVVPKPGRDATVNVLQNLGEPMVFLNDALQLRPDRMVRTLGRFVLNSVLGIGGLFDVAKRQPFDLPHHDNSYGHTLGYHGVKPGPYLYVPILGPATLRDQVNWLPDPIRLVERINGGPLSDAYNIATRVVDGMNQRERNDDELKALLDGAVDPYATFRESFLQNLQGDIDSLRSKDQNGIR